MSKITDAVNLISQNPDFYASFRGVFEKIAEAIDDSASNPASTRQLAAEVRRSIPQLVAAIAENTTAKLSIEKEIADSKAPLTKAHIPAKEAEQDFQQKKPYTEKQDAISQSRP